MKKLIGVLAGLFLCAGMYAQQTISDPNVQVREAKDFHAISLSSAFDVYLTQGGEEKVAVSAADAKYLEYIKVEVNNGVLEIGWENKGKWNTGNKKLKAYISFKKIDKLTASGACDVSIVGTLNAEDLKINLSGASDLDGKIIAQNLSVDMSGSSDMKASGIAAKLKLDLSGACTFKGYEMATNYCDVNASGASDIKITVNKELSADLSGASDVGYKGTGQIRSVKTSGASNVSKTGS
jgi:Putative auto-transporter adhesin, head GIN domain